MACFLAPGCLFGPHLTSSALHFFKRMQVVVLDWYLKARYYTESFPKESSVLILMV